MATKDSKDGDELDMLKATLFKKDLEVISITNKMRQVEDRSMQILGSMEKLSNGTREKIASLTDIINFLTKMIAKVIEAPQIPPKSINNLESLDEMWICCSAYIIFEGNIKDARVLELGTLLATAEQDRKDTITRLNKEMAGLTSAHEFQINNMKLKLEAAQVRLREDSDFIIKKKVIEDENAALKEQLLKEQRDHAEAISDVERVSVQEKERLKKEIQSRVEETKKEMSSSLKDQLHSKTKRTILENEQLKKEAGYHMQQTEILRLQNEKFIKELGEATRIIQLSKELEEDLACRNHMYRQTTRILVYKLQSCQEKQTTRPGSRIGAEQEKKTKIDQLKTQNSLDQDARALLQSEVIKFLYACLEDIEVERIASLPVENVTKSVDPTSRRNNDSKILNFSLTQRQELLIQLLHQATSLRSMTNNMTKNIPKYSSRDQNHGPASRTMMSKVQVDDILALPVEKILREEEIA